MNNVDIGNSIWKKSWGVIFWKNFGDKEGLLLTNTNGIHTFFVRFPIDVAFLKENGEIVKLLENLKPFRLSPFVFSAKNTLEMPAGSIKKHNLAVGDTLILK